MKLRSPRAAGRSRFGTLAGATVLALSMLPALPGGAAADTAPPSAATPTTVSADSLPTVQVNGVVWSQIVVGNRVYATGSFSQARPAGAAPGTNQTARSNILAYDLGTGALITSWAPTLNAQGLALAASADGSRIYVGGDFTQVSGTNRYRVAALDATTGALITSFAPVLNARVRTLAVTANAVYAGGIFTTASGQARTRLAAFAPANGALLAWAPTAEQEVMALVAPAGSGRVVVGGRFTQLNGAANYGLGALDADTGAVLPWAANAVVRNAGANAAIYSLSTDGAQVYGTGYTFGGGGNFEHLFAADAVNGTLAWVNGCRGDTYSAAPIGGVLYSVSHTHDCSQIGEFPQTQPWTYQRAMANTTTQGAGGKVNLSGNFRGRPASEMLHWLPTLAVGSFTGQSQAAWQVTGNSQYVLLGGEFPSVNGTGQQGLARFAVRSVAPNTQGPQGHSTLTPTLTPLAPGTLRASWTAAWDRDNRRLTYELLRGATLGSSVVVGTVTADTTWYTRPVLALTDTTAAPGSAAVYRVRVTDPLGNQMVSATTTGTVPGGTPVTSAYTAAVRADGAVDHWRLGEPAGSTGFDWAGAADLSLATSAQRGTAGALTGDIDTATTFTGASGVPATTTVSRRGPQTFSAEAWFRTGSNTGGKIIGFGNSATAGSTSYDRHVYLNPAGRLVFGAYPGAVRTVTSPGNYNDGQWHHVVAGIGSAGMELFVDGQPVGSRADTTSAQDYTGFWRVGGDTVGSWPTPPSTANLAGSIDEVAVYPTALSAAAIQRHWQIGRGLVANQPPTASFTSTASGLTASFDGSGSSDPDGSVDAYAWDFGDGSSGTGVSPQHAYAAGGTYTVELTVTDDDDATASTTGSVTVTAPPVNTVVAADAFGRTVASGLGSADTGGAWSVTGAGTTSSVADGSARVSVTAGRSATARLAEVQATDTDVVNQVWLEQAATGGGAYLATTVRSSGTADYRARLRIQSTGEVLASVTRMAAGTETSLTTSVAVPGLAYTPGTKLLVRVQAVGSSPTTVRMRAWVEGSAEPTTWLRTVTDSTAGLQGPGAVGLYGYLSGSATTTPTVVRFDTLEARQL